MELPRKTVAVILKYPVRGILPSHSKERRRIKANRKFALYSFDIVK